MPDLKLDWCSYAAAAFACKRWHYSQSIPTPPYNLVGVWEDSAFIGCVIFSRGASAWMHKAYKLEPNEVCELTRVALTKHHYPVSRILKIAMRFLRQQSPGLRMIVSFADPNHSHHGGIYQAGGWLYTGQTAASAHYIDKYGRKWHTRQVSSNGMKVQYGAMRPAVRVDECTKVPERPKHRYVFPLDAEMRAQLQPLAMPYPKRCVASDTIDTPTCPVGESGETPTATLHT